MRWKNAPLVSVVTVCRNAEKEVERTIQSVIQQDFPDFEYWIVDGLSTDNTVDTIEPYRKRLAGFVSEHDTGIYNAMNKAARLVKGQWIIFMNAGDTFASTHVLSDVFSKIDESTLSKTDVIYGETIQKRSVGDFKLPNRPLHYILRGMAFCHQSVFVKTFLLRKFPFNEDYRVVAIMFFLSTLFTACEFFISSGGSFMFRGRNRCLKSKKTTSGKREGYNTKYRSYAALENWICPFGLSISSKKLFFNPYSSENHRLDSTQKLSTQSQ